jgi:hypothetical protein
VPTVAQQIFIPIAHQYIDDAIAHCSERSVDFQVEDIEKFVIAQRLPLDLPEIKSLCDDRPDLIKLDRHYITFKAQIQAEVSDWIQGEPSIDNIDDSEAELDKQESVKVPTHGGGVRVPSREDELDTTPAR